MKLIIDIDESTYKDYKKGIRYFDDEIIEAIANGTPLPKSHGRLIDEDAIWNNVPEIESPLQNHFTTYDFDNWLKQTPAIVESSK